MDSNASVEHICLASGEPDEPAVERITNSHFEQRGRLRRCEAEFTVYNGHYIEVKSKGLSRNDRDYRLDLTFLDPNPRRARKIDWPSALTAALLTVAAILTAAVTPQHALLVPLLISGAAISLIALVHRSYDRVVFCSRHGRAPLLMLLNHNPTRTELQEFIDDLVPRIEKARGDWPDPQQYLSAELREHRRLRDEGVLTEEKYEAIKQRLLGKHGRLKQ